MQFTHFIRVYLKYLKVTPWLLIVDLITSDSVKDVRTNDI